MIDRPTRGSADQRAPNRNNPNYQRPRRLARASGQFVLSRPCRQPMEWWRDTSADAAFLANRETNVSRLSPWYDVAGDDLPDNSCAPHTNLSEDFRLRIWKAAALRHSTCESLGQGQSLAAEQGIKAVADSDNGVFAYRTGQLCEGCTKLANKRLSRL